MGSGVGALRRGRANNDGGATDGTQADGATSGTQADGVTSGTQAAQEQLMDPGTVGQSDVQESYVTATQHRESTFVVQVADQSTSYYTGVLTHPAFGTEAISIDVSYGSSGRGYWAALGHSEEVTVVRDGTSISIVSIDGDTRFDGDEESDGEVNGTVTQQGRRGGSFMLQPRGEFQVPTVVPEALQLALEQRSDLVASQNSTTCLSTGDDSAGEWTIQLPLPLKLDADGYDDDDPDFWQRLPQRSPSDVSKNPPDPTVLQAYVPQQRTSAASPERSRTPSELSEQKPSEFSDPLMQLERGTAPPELSAPPMQQGWDDEPSRQPDIRSPERFRTEKEAVATMKKPKSALKQQDKFIETYIPKSKNARSLVDGPDWSLPPKENNIYKELLKHQLYFRPDPFRFLTEDWLEGGEKAEPEDIEQPMETPREEDLTEEQKKEREAREEQRRKAEEFKLAEIERTDELLADVGDGWKLWLRGRDFRSEFKLATEEDHKPRKEKVQKKSGPVRKVMKTSWIRAPSDARHHWRAGSTAAGEMLCWRADFVHVARDDANLLGLERPTIAAETLRELARKDWDNLERFYWHVEAVDLDGNRELWSPTFVGYLWEYWQRSKMTDDVFAHDVCMSESELMDEARTEIREQGLELDLSRGLFLRKPVEWPKPVWKPVYVPVPSQAKDGLQPELPPLPRRLQVNSVYKDGPMERKLARLLKGTEAWDAMVGTSDRLQAAARQAIHFDRLERAREDQQNLSGIEPGADTRWDDSGSYGSESDQGSMASGARHSQVADPNATMLKPDQEEAVKAKMQLKGKARPTSLFRSDRDAAMVIRSFR